MMKNSGFVKGTLKPEEGALLFPPSATSFIHLLSLFLCIRLFISFFLSFFASFISVLFCCCFSKLKVV
ncbi:hypothetical protein F0562_029821 [Nyssa sinensis]|uniref:Uncharacterized protein n=1 Tax=Nyssa sinensis TaxID=561372 RepID=A0A5J5AZ19_9ASTE|nr:hypothetical protein F0562_029821 [Nyssa sinensis]